MTWSCTDETTSAAATRAAALGAKDAVVGDFSTIAGTKSVADGINKLGRFNAVIHNAGIGYREQRRIETEAGVPCVFAVNVLAPYVLTCLIEGQTGSFI